MTSSKPKLDPRTLRAIADELSDAGAQYADYARKHNYVTSLYWQGKADFAGGLIRRLRSRATRAERKRGGK